MTCIKILYLVNNKACMVVDPLGTKAVILGLGVATFSKARGMSPSLALCITMKGKEKKILFWLIYSLGIIVTQV